MDGPVREHGYWGGIRDRLEISPRGDTLPSRRSLSLRRRSTADFRRSTVPHARARARVVPISELVFGTLNQNWSSLEPSLEFAAIAGTPRIENGGTFAVDLAYGRRDQHNFDVQPDGPQPVQEKAQDYSSFGLKSQTPT
jgi:hypothetical protein